MDDAWREWLAVVCHPFKYVRYVRVRHRTVAGLMSDMGGVREGVKMESTKGYVLVVPPDAEMKARLVS